MLLDAADYITAGCKLISYTTIYIWYTDA